MEPLINNKIGAENQLFFLNRERVYGIQSVDATQNLGLQPLVYAGIGNKTINFIPVTEQNNTLNINSLLINKDYFLNLTIGSDLANIYILKDKNDTTNNYILHSGYFTDYNSNYNIGNVPTISTTFIAIKDAGKLPISSLSLDAQNDLTNIISQNLELTNILVPSIGTITLNVDDFTTNRLQSYSLSIKSNKIPVYFIGQKTPKRIDNLSSEIQCSFSFEIGLYEIKRLRNFPQNNIVKNLTITVNDYSNNQNICIYNFNNLNLVSENYSISANENLLINQTYQTKIFN